MSTRVVHVHDRVEGAIEIVVHGSGEVAFRVDGEDGTGVVQLTRSGLDLLRRQLVFLVEWMDEAEHGNT